MVPRPKHTKCGVCGATDCRLYRPYGEFRRPENDRCNGCVGDEERAWYVPLIVDENDGGVWGYTSVPQDACKKFYALPEAKPDGWCWDPGTSRWNLPDDP